jgi:HlyD family secretion protein
MQGTFRKSALDRLSSPEQIDQLLQVTPLRAWIALAAIAAVLFIGLIWGIFGSLSSYVSGSGILVREGGAFEIVAYGEGRVLGISTEDGAMVKKDALVAKLELPELNVKLENARARLAELQAEDALETASEKANLALSLTAMDEQKETLTHAAADFDQQVEALTEQVNIQQDLQKRGLIPKSTLLNTKTSMASAKQSASNARVELANNASRRAEFVSAQREKAAARRLQIASAEYEKREVEKQHETATEVRSPYDGRILDVVASEGNVVHRNQPVMMMEIFDKPLEVVLFIPAADGKRIKPGMHVQISPSTARREEYGFLEAKVQAISDFPVTDESAMSLLHNQRLIEQLTKQGSVVVAEVMLEKDPQTPSGFRWSSSKGPPMEITSGTLCEGRIVVRGQRPITLVLPYLKKLLGGN